MTRRRAIVLTLVLVAITAVALAVALRPTEDSHPTEHAATEHAATEHPESDIAYYTCPMHPSVEQSVPGKCPICGMTLTSVTKTDLREGTVVVDEVRRQQIGVRIGPVEVRPLVLEIRAVGRVQYDETRLSDVNLRMSGWVQRLLVDETGQRVKRGQTLFTLYSPELYAAQVELLSALRKGDDGATVLADLAGASKQRLRLLGMSDGQIQRLTKRGKPWEHMPITAPASGYVIEKAVVEGAHIEAGTRVYRIADLSRVWIDADIYEADLPHLKVGQAVRVELPYVQKESFEGRLDYIYPTLNDKTRTARVRIVLPNQDLRLKPDMYANVLIDVDLGARLAVPDSAVVYTGPRRLVFVDLGEGRLRPTEVKLGVHAQGFYEIVDGLKEGERVVTSGNFLIAAESRIRSAIEYWGSGAGHAGH